MSRTTKIILATSLLIAGLFLVLWGITPSPKPEPSTSASTSTAVQAASEASRIQRQLVTERRRLEQLETALHQVTSQEFSARLSRDRLNDVNLRLEPVNRQIEESTAEIARIESLERDLRRENQDGRNTDLAGLETEIQNVNSSILVLQSQAAAIPDSGIQIAQLETLRSNLMSQIRLSRVNAETENLNIVRESEAARNDAGTRRAALLRQQADLQTEKTYWTEQLNAAGNENLRRQRIDYLETQIVAQKAEINRLTQNVAGASIP